MAEIAEDVRERFAGFVREEVNPGAIERDVEGIGIPRTVLRKSAELGLLNYSIPRALGGGGADLFRWGVVLEELGYHCEDGSFPLVLSLHAAVANAIHQAASPAVAERVVAPLVRGERFACFAYSDGTDAFSFRSTAKKKGDRYLLDGDKQMVTGGLEGDVFMTYVRREDNDDLAVFLIERDDPGVTIEPVEVSGFRAAGMARLRFEGVELSEERMLVPFDGISHAQLFLNDRRGLLVCGLLGRMRAIVEDVAVSVGQTMRYGRPLSELTSVQATLGRMHVAVETARAMAHRALHGFRHADRSSVFDPDMAVAKYYVIEQAITVATSALRVTGGCGYMRHSNYERYLRDFHGGIAGGGAQDILEVNLGAYLSSMLGRRHCRELNQ